MDEEQKNICRVCLHTTDLLKYISLFEQCNDSLISDKINSITNIDIREGDGLPARICPDCLLELENALKFKLKCENSNLILRSEEVLDKNEDEQTLLDIKKEELKYELVDQENEHQKDEHLEDDHQSHECDWEFIKGKQDVRKSKAIDLKLECHDCGGFFKSKCKLRVHWKTAHKPKLICEVCRRVFSSYKAYHLHCKNKKKTCLNAGKVHIEGEGKSRIFHCKECGYKVKKMYQMNIHLVTHSGERPFKCDKCTRCFTQLSSLHAHKEVAHNEFRVEATCQYCGKFLQGRNKVYKHMLMHQPKSVQCDICNKYLRNKNNLKDHLRRHAGFRPYTCEICGSAFHSLPEISNHKLTHNKVKTKSCDICGYTARRMETIKKHKSKHTSTNHPCMICGAFVETAQYLAIHMRRHLERPYTCPHCDLTFHGKKSCSRHVIKKHRCSMLVNSEAKPASIKK